MCMKHSPHIIQMIHGSECDIQIWWTRLKTSHESAARVRHFLPRVMRVIIFECYTNDRASSVLLYDQTHTPVYTHPFNGPLSGTTQVSRYQKGKTNLDFIEARDSEWQWHQLGCMQVCTFLQTDNHASTPPLSFLQAGCPSCAQPTASKHWRHKALKAYCMTKH